MKTMCHRELGLAIAPVAVVAAGLGYLLFGPLGVALWAPLAVTVTFLLFLLRGFSPGLAIAVPLLLAGAALYDSTDLTWGGADAPDGTRYKATPIGLTHVLSPGQTVSPTVQCRLYLGNSDADLCVPAPGATAAYWQLLAVFPLVCLSIAVCLLGSLGQCRPRWRLQFPHRTVAATATVLPALALWLFSRSVGPALAVLAPLEAGTAATLGTMEVTAAIVLCLAASVVTLKPEWLSNQALNPTGTRPATSACPENQGGWRQSGPSGLADSLVGEPAPTSRQNDEEF